MELGPCLSQCGDSLPTGCQLQSAPGPICWEGSPTCLESLVCSSPGPGSAAGGAGCFLLPWSLLSPPSPPWQLWAPAVPRPCDSLALPGPGQLLLSQAGNIWLLSPSRDLSIWCHRWCGFVWGSSMEIPATRCHLRLIPLPSEPGLSCHRGLEVGWKNRRGGMRLRGCP